MAANVLHISLDQKLTPDSQNKKNQTYTEYVESQRYLVSARASKTLHLLQQAQNRHDSSSDSCRLTV